MSDENSKNETGRSCPLPSNPNSIIYVKEGQLCPNCEFARLKKEPGNIIRCPICGWGNGAGCT